jgi:hypothetical protein
MTKAKTKSINIPSKISGASKRIMTRSDQLLLQRTRRRGKEKAANLRRIEREFQQAKRQGWKEEWVKVGDTVQIMTPISGLTHRKIQTGIVVERDGYYVYIRPHWLSKERIIECYDSELRILKRAH